VLLPSEVSSSAAVSRDLPIPASPAIRTTWPSPVFALAQRRNSRSHSSFRPTRAVRPVACSTSKRLSIDLARSTARADAAMPWRYFGPRSCSSKRSPRSRRVPSAMTTVSAPRCPAGAPTNLAFHPRPRVPGPPPNQQDRPRRPSRRHPDAHLERLLDGQLADRLDES